MLEGKDLVGQYVRILETNGDPIRKVGDVMKIIKYDGLSMPYKSEHGWWYKREQIRPIVEESELGRAIYGNSKELSKG